MSTLIKKSWANQRVDLSHQYINLVMFDIKVKAVIVESKRHEFQKNRV